MDETCNQVRVQASKERVVRFTIPGQEVPARGVNSPRAYAKISTLCVPISKTRTREPERLVLKLTKGQLFEMELEKSVFWIDRAVEPISLFECFRRRREFFTERAKRILSLIIGYAAFHLNRTAWLQPELRSANIEFFQTTQYKTPL